MEQADREEHEEPMRTLVVDDVESLRRYVSILLDKAPGFDVVGEASNGKECLEKAAELGPDLILLDISMPGMDGLEVLEKLQRCEDGPRVVMLSGFEAHTMAEATAELGALGYLEKGLAPDALVQALTGLVNGPGEARA